MSVTPELIEQLLYESESAALDFKRDQYKFENATDAEKSELLKDILAFANSWARTDAYILVGVEEVPSGKSNVVGVAQHLDDAKLQQFVNSKTQRPLHFSYHAVMIEGNDIGVIHIPPQERPLYLKRDFGNLKKDTVCVRRGSSTAIASPDEISKMRQASGGSLAGLPVLDVQFYDTELLSGLGTELIAETQNVEVPRADEIPDYYEGAARRAAPKALLKFNVIRDAWSNRHYYREYALYAQTRLRHTRTNFLVSNTGHSVAHDVRLRFAVERFHNRVLLADASQMPTPPPVTMAPRIPYVGAGPDVHVQRAPDRWIVEAELGKIQPRGVSHTVDGLYVGAKEELDLPLTITISADNLPVPRTQQLFVRIRPESKRIGVHDLLELLSSQKCNNQGEGDE